MTEPHIRIALPSGHLALVDADDAHRLTGHRWHYARTSRHGKGIPKFYVMSVGNQTYLHRLIMDAQPGQIVDHINGDPLDNRRANLRLVTRHGNARNRAIHQTKGRTSRFKGVSWEKKQRKWLASIYADKVLYRIGTFTDEAEAARRYDDASWVLHRDEGRRNFPHRTPEPIELRAPAKRDESYGWRAAVIREP